MSQNAFQRLIGSYMEIYPHLTEEEVERTLREHARQFGGCISCKYSIGYYNPEWKRRNYWLLRGCQLGFSQSNCNVYASFPADKESS